MYQKPKRPIPPGNFTHSISSTTIFYSMLKYKKDTHVQIHKLGKEGIEKQANKHKQSESAMQSTLR